MFNKTCTHLKIFILVFISIYMFRLLPIKLDYDISFINCLYYHIDIEEKLSTDVCTWGPFVLILMEGEKEDFLFICF